MFYILHGEDEFGLSEELAGLRARLAEGDPAMAELNTTILDGQRLIWGALRHACDTIPFMSERRLVIVYGLLGRLAAGGRAKGAGVGQDEEPASKRTFRDDLADYLPKLPPTTRLVFVEDRRLPASHPILKVAEAERKGARGFIKQFNKPKDGELPGWIRHRARDKAGELDGEAIALLAALVGNDLRTLDQEIDKLLLYADGRTVSGEDVRLLVSQAREESIFDLVDSVGRRETGQALLLLHRLLDEGKEPLYLLAMLARQVRILIQVSELRNQGLGQTDITERLKLHPYVVQKAMAQADNFSLRQLEGAHQHLLETDWQIKTGGLDEVVALDTLIVTLTQA